MNLTINITCDNCHNTHKVERDEHAPEWAVSMGCNWCPKCEGDACDYYKEWYNGSDESEEKGPLPDNPNQLVMPFEIEEIVSTPNV